jgi:NADPH-dependent ferric siderophore reductase
VAGRLKQVKPENAQVILAEVARTERVSPNVVRVTFGGKAIRQFRPLGLDQWFRLFLHWLPRTDPHAVPGTLASETVQAAITAATLPPGRGYAHLVGESSLVTGLRRHLVAAGMPKPRITFIGYWRVGHAAVG